MDLFEHKAALEQKSLAPLAERMRPKTFETYLGQHALTGETALLRKMIEKDQIPSLILWGPPGSGKTTLAHIIAEHTTAHFIPFSAVHGSVKQIRDIIKIAKDKWTYGKKRTLLFVDEIHRFSKSQQDAFLPVVEDGTIILIGATTENPSFEINAALLSRCKVFVLESLTETHLIEILKQALQHPEGFKKEQLSVDNNTLTLLAHMSGGDARAALNTLEIAATLAQNHHITEEDIKQALQRSHLYYDKNGDQHFAFISALHKSMRGSDVNASLYWLARMLEGGEDPRYIARRLMRFASEDIGLADPQALLQASSAMQAAQTIGMPEVNVIMAQAVAYLAKAPKSNALYMAYREIKKDISLAPNEPVPLHLRNQTTTLTKRLGHGKNYKYTPNYENPQDAQQDYLPPPLKNKQYFPYENK